MKLPSVVWSLVQQAGRQGVNMLVFAILGVLLTPRDIGVLSVGTIWVAFMLVFAELGFGAALIQRQEVTPQHLSSTFVMNAALGLILAVIGFLGAGLFARLMGVPDARDVVAALSLVFITDALALTQMALAQRELRFQALAIRDIGASLIGGAVGVSMALLGYGVWSLVGQTLATSVAELVLIWSLSPWRPRLSEFSAGCVRELWGYSSRIFAFSLFKNVVQNIDKVLVGVLLGPVALGLYTFAYRLVIYPVTFFVGAVGSYLFPRFARLQSDPDAVRALYLFAIRTLVSVVMPAMLLLALLAPVVVPLFGDLWLGAIPLAQLFAAVAVLQTLISPSGQLMKALARPGWLLNWSIGFTIITAVAFLASSRWGATGVGLGLLIAHLVGLPIIHTLNRRMIGVTTRAVVAALAPAFLAALGLGALTYGTLQAGSTRSPALAVIGLAASALAYVALLAVLDRSLFATLLRGLRNV